MTAESSNPPAVAPAGYVTEEYGAQSLAAVSRVYKRLGLLPESTDFAAELAEYARLERIFYYEARKDVIVITPDAAELARAMIRGPGRSAEQIPLVLALTQALQEQHFRWQEKLKRISDEDRKLAFAPSLPAMLYCRIRFFARIAAKLRSSGHPPNHGEMVNCVG